ncbi:MAG: Minf_1886 family protein [bacterium]
MEDDNITTDLERLAASDQRYRVEAYVFVMSSLEYTLARLGRRGHVSGGELLKGIKDFAKERFGPTARMVFEHWGVRKTDDFGEIVFSLVGAGILGKTESDSLEDFKDVYDFAEVFERGYDWKIKGAI